MPQGDREVTRILLALVAILTLSTAAFWVAYSRQSVHLTDVQSQNRDLRVSIVRTQQALEQYRVAHDRDKQSLITLDRKNKELQSYVADIPDGAAQCLSPSDVERLRQLWP